MKRTLLAKSSKNAARLPIDASRQDRSAVIDRVATELAASMVIEESFFDTRVLELSREAPAFQSKVETLKKRILKHLGGREEELLPQATVRVDERGLTELVRRMKALFFRRIEAAAIATPNTWAFAA
jgi:hypothetical protein